MRHLRQTMLGPRGNCFSACIAMLLDLEVDDVPNYAHLPTGNEQDDATNEWLAARGYRLVSLIANGDAAGVMQRAGIATFIAGGPSPREGCHAVVVHRGALVDPHPSDAGLLRVDEHIFLVRIGTPLETWKAAGIPTTIHSASGADGGE